MGKSWKEYEAETIRARMAGESVVAVADMVVDAIGAANPREVKLEEIVHQVCVATGMDVDAAGPVVSQALHKLVEHGDISTGSRAGYYVGKRGVEMPMLRGGTIVFPSGKQQVRPCGLQKFSQPWVGFWPLRVSVRHYVGLY